MELEPIIGLEIHVQLKTKTKMFCTCDNSGENQSANTCVCQVCLGQPGTLPVANKLAIQWSAKTALALNCTIDEYSKFDRKHYFYPDLPKAYQISQFDQPIGKGGYLEIFIPETKEVKKIRINRLHLEEDAAKLLHPTGKKYSLVDYNRGGTPLMEIVTEPDLKTPQEAKIFLQDLRQILRYLDVSEADMEKGHLRCDANISMRPIGDSKLYPKTEIKNMNSFKMIEKALEYEIKRQSKLWFEGTPTKILTTRGWNDAKGMTEEQRTKEEAHDYRYFPEPDIPPIHFALEAPGHKCEPKEIAIDVKCIKAELPELPEAKMKRFIGEYDLNLEDVKILTEEKETANFAEQVFSELKAWIENLEEAKNNDKIWEENRPKIVKMATNLLINVLLPTLQKMNLSIKSMKMNAENFAELITLIFEKKVNNATANTMIDNMVATGADPTELIKSEGLAQISDTEELEKFIKQVIKENPQPVLDYKAGKERALQALVGQVMAKTKGKANPETTLRLLKNSLK
ncbi:MAG: Asp-tRNA(Asn)/Glu-tRNA(Gln) amidotransferase subunit GatB [Patescibacteria group bacterium]|nr:Asp-tRNA(Asn)/Glu-tRNA(Gln) amidotransferase subunit GatB [Patescibacteria group bacterium]